ncbi:MAG: DNA translocase FtsK 4TM domain-containing protein [Phycisphaeraceae bacterium]|nr:DNA translocase FtsK 4TM domain-containing protein [Phycisphaeraceae bacterium]
MAKRTKKTDNPSATQALAAYRGVGWAVLAGLWLMLVASLVSYHPDDAPSHAVGVAADPVHNWVGVVGAAMAYELYAVLGAGVWALVIGMAVYLYRTATRRATNQIVLRGIGLVMIAVTVSALIAILGNTYALFRSPMPEGTGGLLSLYVNDHLIARFETFGSVVLLLVSFWVGAILTADKIVLAIPKAIAEVILRICDIDPKKLPLPKLNIAGRLAGALAPLTNRLRTAPEAWDGAETDVEEGPEEAGAPLTPKQLKRKKRKEAKAKKKADSTPTAKRAMEAIANAEEEDDVASDAPDAYTKGKQKLDPDALREKMAQMPINFAPKAATAPAAPVEQDLSGYKFPGQDLLEEPEHDFTAEQEAIVRDQAVKLESAMQQYNIQGEVVGIDSGPVITLFEARLAPGTKVSRLNGVSTDLARAMKAQNIRIVANMAGKDTVGIEVPNIKRELVRVKELMQACPESAEMNLPMFLGKDASGNPLVEDLNKMPHMLIAGTTGSGKSVCMNSIIMSFLFTKRPDELKLVLVDPKMVEMSMFKNIPHLMCPVVTEMSKAAAILEWAVTKMDERYELLAEVGVRDIGTYNKLGWDEIKDRMEPATEDEAARIPKKLPYMVFVIDELADLMMTNKEVEGFIVRIAQKARAVGIHLILATQRPSANVVTGLIKSNMPCRICMKVSSGMDSRIVLDQKGGELLLGHGDMLFLSPRSSELTRAQGCLIDDMEVRKTVKFLKTIAQQSFEPQLVQIKSGDQVSVDEDSMNDPLFDKAVQIVIETKRGSVSLLQRRLTIGYARSSRLIEAMAASGILGDHKGSQAREVQITLEEWDAMKQMQAEQASGGPTQSAEGASATGHLVENTPAAEAASAYAEEVITDEDMTGDDSIDEEDDDFEIETVDELEEEDFEEEPGEEDDEEYEVVAEDGEEYEEEEEDEDPDAEAEYEEEDEEAEDEDGEWEYEYEEVEEDEDEEIAA